MKNTKILFSAAVATVALTFGATSAPAFAGPSVTSSESAETAKARYHITVKCQLVRHGGAAVGYIYGTGTGNTRPAAAAAAKKNADTKVPRGYYKRHCKGRGGGGSW